MNKFKLILGNPWTIAFGTVVATKTMDKILGTNILGFFVSVFKYEIKLGVVLFILVLFYGFHLAYRKLHGRKFNGEYPFLGYKEDIFDNIPYRWTYKWSGDKYNLGEFAAYCPTCNCRIVDNKCQKRGKGCNMYIFEIKEREELKARICYEIENRFKINVFEKLG